MDLIDREKCPETDDMEDVVSEYRKYIEVKMSGTPTEFLLESEIESTTENSKSTGKTYTNCLQKDILPAFKRRYNPFKFEWLLNCTEEKITKFDDEDRHVTSSREPIHVTSKIIEEALKKYVAVPDQYGSYIQTILSTFVSFMSFLEFYFGSKYETLGPEPLATAKIYHAMVKSYIDGLGLWKFASNRRERAQKDKNVLEGYKFPDKDKKFLEAYQAFLESGERYDDILEVFTAANPNAPAPSDVQFCRITNTVMSAGQMSTGCRPVVLTGLTNSPYTDKKPGL